MPKIFRVSLVLGLSLVTLWLMLFARFPVKCNGGDCEKSSQGWAWWER